MYRTGDRNQTTLMPPSVEDYITQDNPAINQQSTRLHFLEADVPSRVEPRVFSFGSIIGERRGWENLTTTRKKQSNEICLCASFFARETRAPNGAER